MFPCSSTIIGQIILLRKHDFNTLIIICEYKKNKVRKKFRNLITITEDRKRVSGEIVPERAEQSATKDNDEEKYGAGNAIDLVSFTWSAATPGSDGTTWFKLTLDKPHCVEQVIGYSKTGVPTDTWTCTNSGCINCVGNHCNLFTLTVRTKGAVSDLSSILNCRYGDTVKLDISGSELSIVEIAVIRKTGKTFPKIAKILHAKKLVCRLFVEIRDAKLLRVKEKKK